MAINVTPPTTPVAPIPDSTNINIQSDLFVAIGITGAGGGEYAIGDILERVVTYTGTTISSTVWNNVSTGAILTVAPPGIDIAAKETTPLTNSELRATPVEVYVTNQVAPTPPATQYETVVTTYTARAADTSTGLNMYAKDDIIQSIEVVDNSSNNVAVISTEWKNITQGTTLATPPNTADLIVSPSNALTNAELRATPISVLGKDFESELYVSLIDTAEYLKGDIIRREVVVDFTTDVTTAIWYNVTQNGVINTIDTAHLVISSGSSASIEAETLNYIATADGASGEYFIDDELQRTVQWDNTTSPPTKVAEVWYNVTRGTTLSVSPIQTEYRIFSGGDESRANACTIERTLTSGVVAEGAFEVSIANIGNADGTILGTSIPPGYAIDYRADNNDFLTEISYDATGTEFLITIIRTLPVGAPTALVLTPTILPITSPAAIDLTVTSSTFTSIGAAGTHLSTDWEIYSDVGLTTLVESAIGSTTSLTSFTSLGLANSTTYYIRVRYTSTLSLVSEWSPVVTFSTEALKAITTPTLTSFVTNNTAVPYTFINVEYNTTTSPYQNSGYAATLSQIEHEVYSDAALTQLEGTFTSSSTDGTASTWVFEDLMGNFFVSQLSPNQDYYIRVRHSDTDGIVSDWSPAITFKPGYTPAVLGFALFGGSSTPSSAVDVFVGSALPGAFIQDRESGAIVNINPALCPYTVTITGTAVNGQWCKLRIAGCTNYRIQNVDSGIADYNDGDIMVAGWGNTPITSLDDMFNAEPGVGYKFQRESSVERASVSPDLSQCTSAVRAFANAYIKFNIQAWDFSGVTQADYMFQNSVIDYAPRGTPEFYFVGGGTYDFSTSTLNFANMTSMVGFLSGAHNLIVGNTTGSNAITHFNNVQSIDISNVTDISYFFGSTATIPSVWNVGVDIRGITAWDVSHITSMKGLFRGKYITSVNAIYDERLNYLCPDISGWNTSNVTDMSEMFSWSTWPALTSMFDTSSVSNFSKMFENTKNFDWSITPQINVTAAATNLSGMFMKVEMTTWTNPWLLDVSSWITSNVTDMSSTFNIPIMTGTTIYNLNQQPGVAGWDVSSVTNMNNMFSGYGANNGTISWSFNEDISAWNVSNVTDMSYMFASCVEFNADLSSWIVSNVTNMQGMFSNAASFNQDISAWDVSSVDNFRIMFFSADAFNQDISGWDVSGAATLTDPELAMQFMFYSAETFNQDLSGWCVSNITSEPVGFATGGNWILPKPVWGTCP